MSSPVGYSMVMQGKEIHTLIKCRIKRELEGLLKGHHTRPAIHIHWACFGGAM